MSDLPVRVLISTSSFGREDSSPLARLRQAGISYELNPYGRTLTEQEVGSLLVGARGLIAGTEPLTAAVLAGAEQLKVISRVGSGLDSVDIEAAKRLAITVLSTPEAPVDAVAELTIAGMLAILRKVHVMDQAMRAGRWEKRTGNLLTGKTVGIVGLGRIGKRLTELLAPFRVRVVASDIRPDKGWVRQRGITMLSLKGLLSTADLVTLHVSGKPSQGYLLGQKEIASMKQGAILINAARGGLVDENALVEALERGNLSGAYLDTFGEEPYSGKLVQAPNTLLTPHIGSYALETRTRMEMEAVENLLNVMDPNKKGRE